MPNPIDNSHFITADFDSDTIAELLGTFPAASPGYVTFEGYLAPATQGVRRLYLDNTMWWYLEISEGDIKAQFQVPLDANDVQSTIWVRRNAVITKCRSDEAHCIADDLYGDPGGGPNRPGGRP